MGDSKAKVGFVGVGLMGHGMAKHILANGHSLTIVAHSNREPVADLINKGASEAAHLAELARISEVIILCVSNSDVVEEVIFGPDGLLDSANPGTIFIDTGTSFPDNTRSVNRRLREAGMLFADAPLSRSPARAQDGELVSLISCAADLYERIKPILETYSETVVHVGLEVGMAHEVKLINNFIALSYVCTWSEAYNACLAKGIAPQVLHAVVSSAGMNCVNFQNYSKFVLENTQTGHKFSIKNCHKDIRYYMRFAKEAGLSTTMAEPVLQLFQQAEDRGYGDDYGPVLPKIIGEINGTAAGELPRAKGD